jgi:hypothetical protein
MLPRLLLETFAKPATQTVDERDHGQDHQQNGADFSILHDAQRTHQLETDPTRTDHPHPSRCAEVVLPAIDRHVRELNTDHLARLPSHRQRRCWRGRPRRRRVDRVRARTPPHASATARGDPDENPCYRPRRRARTSLSRRIATSAPGRVALCAYIRGSAAGSDPGGGCWCALRPDEDIGCHRRFGRTVREALSGAGHHE